MKVSIIIPAFNKWDFTKKCLQILAECTDVNTLGGVEVILVDNASTDATAQEAALLGADLFAENFHLLRLEKNFNFAGGCNLGAAAAKGAFLVFLNNDTILTPGWLPPLLEMFTQHDNLAACGPLLLYPRYFGYKDRVQHLGVCVYPSGRVDHLYKGFPAKHPAVQRERNLQVITGAVFVIPASLYRHYEGFYEGYINGFEDVDLCLRMAKDGYKFMVNPKSVVYHLESQTRGINEQMDANHTLLQTRTGQYKSVDLHTLAAADGFQLHLTPWLTFSLEHSPTELAALQRLSKSRKISVLEQLLEEYPFWRQGYVQLAEAYVANGDLPKALDVCSFAGNVAWSMEMQWLHFSLFLKAGLPNVISAMRPFFFMYIYTKPMYYSRLSHCQKVFIYCKLSLLAQDCVKLEANTPHFFENTMHPYMRELLSLGFFDLPISQSVEAYNVWVDLPEGQASFRKKTLIKFAPPQHLPRISLLMPAHNPEEPLLEQALSSIKALQYSNWELCLADNGSSPVNSLQTVHQYLKEEKRIVLTRCSANSQHVHFEACSAALEMATGDYCIVMRTDTVLASDALDIFAAYIVQHPEAQVFLADEDLLDHDGIHHFPYFRIGIDTDLLLQQNRRNALLILRADLVQKLRGVDYTKSDCPEFDLMLRALEECGPQCCVHIPHTLGHWVGEESELSQTGTRTYPPDAFKRTLTKYLHRTGQKAIVQTVPGTPHCMVQYAFSSKAFLDLIVVIPPTLAIVPAILQPLLERTKKLTRSITFIGQQEALSYIKSTMGDSLVNSCYIPLATGSKATLEANERLEHNFIESINSALGRVLSKPSDHGVVGVLEAGHIPQAVNGDWVQEILAHALRPQVGMVGGTVYAKNGTLLHAGECTLADGFLHPVNKGIHKNSAEYAGQQKMVTQAVAVSPSCSFASHKNWQIAGELPTEMGLRAFAHASLLLQQNGLKTLNTPHAGFVSTFNTGQGLLSPCSAKGEAAFYSRWGKAVATHRLNHPGLLPVDGGFTLVWDRDTLKNYE